MRLWSSLGLIAQGMTGPSGMLRPLAAASFAFAGNSRLFILAFMGGCCAHWEVRPCMPAHVREAEGQGLCFGLAHRMKQVSSQGEHGQREAGDSLPLWAGLDWAETWQGG